MVDIEASPSLCGGQYVTDVRVSEELL